MATNKTRCVFFDNAENETPYNLRTVLEFEIYQEAIDYCTTTIKDFTTFASARSFGFYIYSYENTSIRLYSNGSGVFESADITFPVS